LQILGIIALVYFIYKIFTRKKKPPSQPKPKPRPQPKPQPKPKPKPKPKRHNKSKDPRTLIIDVAMAVAMADKKLDDKEGETIQNWIKQNLYIEGHSQKSKNLYNNALRDSYSLAESGNLVLSDVCKRLNRYGNTAQKYDAVELAYKVMAADGILHENEAIVINTTAKALGITSTELEEIRDREIIKFETIVDAVDQTKEELIKFLGIDPSLSKKEICTKLKNEFIKWNSRLSILDEGKEKENAQRMLDLIGKARKKYGC
jgi:uncharacterized tellurite resistance protein B-like protein